MDNSILRVDAMLVEQIGLDSAEYKETRDKIEENLQELSSTLSLPIDSNLIGFATLFYKTKKTTPDVNVLKTLIDKNPSGCGDESVFLPLFLTIKMSSLKATFEEFSGLFSLLCKKAKFAAADLGDENNCSFIRACINIIDYCFFEEIEDAGVSMSVANNFSSVVTESFKNNLWERIDTKIESLKVLKDRIWEDGDSVIDIVKSLKTSAKKGAALSNSSEILA